VANPLSTVRVRARQSVVTCPFEALLRSQRVRRQAVPFFFASLSPGFRDTHRHPTKNVVAANDSFLYPVAVIASQRPVSRTDHESPDGDEHGLPHVPRRFVAVQIRYRYKKGVEC
jgi:hypothetical protein